MIKVGAEACPVCLAETRFPFREDGRWHLYRCAGCETVYMDPMPDAAILAELYTDAYDGARSGYFAKQDKKLRRSAGRLRMLSRLSPPPGNFLDIGCNGGFAVEAARRAGYRGWGLEPDPASVAYARETFNECSFVEGLIEDYYPVAPDGAPLTFDLAYCSEVIEHVPDPRAFVTHMHRLVKPGGLLYLTTPDISHWRRPKDLDTWDGYCPPSHCVYFTPDSLAALLHGCGFRVLRKAWAWKPGIKLIAERTDAGG